MINSSQPCRDIVILLPAAEGLTAYEALEPSPDPAVFLGRDRCRIIEIRRATANAQLLELASAPPDVIINLCDGCPDEDRPGLDVVQALERLRIPFTGASSKCYDIERDGQKMAAVSAGLQIPPYVTVRHEADLRAAENLQFPLIVKHPRGYNSVGLSKASRVDDVTSLKRQVQKMIDAFGAALVEEFIDGREFTVLVVEPEEEGGEPEALAPLEFRFPESESFKHFDLKWVDYDAMESIPVADPELGRQLRQAAAMTFLALGHDGYARCDFRMDQQGDIYFLEINSNPSVFYPEGGYGSADLILAADAMGHQGFINRLIACALRRHSAHLKPWRVGFAPDRGFGLYANHAIATGERVVVYEQEPVTLVSRSHVDTHWRGMLRNWFDAYAYPISDQVSVIWNDKPENWRPINHACDPNLWFDGLDYVARRAIAAGEELTTDYATFCGPGMKEFTCACGAESCRGVVKGGDCYLPELVNRYGLHVTDYVKSERTKVLQTSEVPYDIRPAETGVGLFAVRTWRRGEIIADLVWGPTFTEATRWSYQIGENLHAEMIPHELRYINHSCDPNVFFDIDRQGLRALTDIRVGDELRFFYPSNEWEMCEPFDCCCGAERCIGRIGGARILPRDQLHHFEFSPLIQHLLGIVSRPAA